MNIARKTNINFPHPPLPHSQPTMEQTELLRRTCVAYPWARECQGVAPIVPSPDESASLWTNPYQQHSAGFKKDGIPLGTRCEPVQLVPLDTLRGNRPADPPIMQPGNSMYLQFPVARSMGEGVMVASIFPTARGNLINNFL
jgi:hypothetical protein